MGGRGGNGDIILPHFDGGALDATGANIGLTERHTARRSSSSSSGDAGVSSHAASHLAEGGRLQEHGGSNSGCAPESMGRLLLTLTAVSTPPDELEAALTRAERWLEERPAATAAALCPALLEAGLAREQRRRRTAQAVLARLVGRSEACRGPLLRHFCAVVDNATSVVERPEEQQEAVTEDRICVLGVAVAARIEVQKALERGDPSSGRPIADREGSAEVLGIQMVGFDGGGLGAPLPPTAAERWAADVAPWLGVHRAAARYLSAVAAVAAPRALPPTRLHTALAECGLAILRLAAEVVAMAEAPAQHGSSSRLSAAVGDCFARGAPTRDEAAQAGLRLPYEWEALRQEARQGLLPALCGWLVLPPASSASASPAAETSHLAEEAMALTRALGAAPAAAAWASWLRCVGWECAALRSRKQLTVRERRCPHTSCPACKVGCDDAACHVSAAQA